MHDGELWERTTQALRTKEIGVGLWVGTPTKSMSVPNENYSEGRLPSPRALAEGKLSGREKLPTPTCHNAKENASPSEYTRNTPTLATHAGGRINPQWVEYLMGWSIGWTDLKPLETDKSHKP